jgi:hypothetical protein
VRVGCSSFHALNNESNSMAVCLEKIMELDFMGTWAFPLPEMQGV